MQITLKNKKYELNARRAIELGVLKVLREPITRIDIGDVFKKEGHNAIVFIKAIWSSPSYDPDFHGYSFVGLDRKLMPHSNYGALISYREAMDMINEEELNRIGNINEQFKEALKKIEKDAEVD